MALVHELSLPGVTLPNANAAKQMLAAAFWAWFDTHRSQVVFSRKVWFVNVTLTIGQLESVFVQIFGPRSV